MILGLIYTIGLPSVGLEAGAAIGVVAGVCRIIPYVDVIVGGLLSAIVIIYTGASAFTAFGTVAIFAGAQTLDAILITPRVIGDRVGLHPLIVMLSVLSFGYWLGFYGVLLAIPLLALGKVTVDMFLPYYLNSAAYRPREEGAPQ
jgi:predicted PurR-regulated permease PerM